MDWHAIVEVLRESAIFKKWGRADLARLLPHLKVVELEAGERLCRRGDPAGALFVLLAGSAKVVSPFGGGQDGVTTILRAGSSLDCAGQEAAINAAHYLYTIEAMGPLKVVAVPAEPLRAAAPSEWLAKAVPHLSLIDRQSGGGLEKNPSDQTLRTRIMDMPIRATGVARVFKVLTRILRQEWTWLPAILLPAIVLLLGDPPQWLASWLPMPEGETLDWSQRHFVAIVVAALVMWIFNLVPIYAGALFALFASLVLGVAPTGTVLSGFASESFFMAMSILGFALLLKGSGLPYRAALYLLRRCAGKPFWANLGLMTTGLLLTPVIPTTTVRTVLLSPLLTDMSDALGHRQAGRGATHLAFSMFAGATFFYPLFMTSSSLNFVLYGLLPEQLRQEFHWSQWFVTAAPSGLLLLALCVVAGWTMHHGSTSGPTRPLERLEEQVRLLGSLRESPKEWAALGGLVLLLVAISTSAIHRIDPPWIALGVFYVLLSVGVLDKSDLEQGIDWSFLIFVGAIVGLVATVKTLGLDAVIAAAFDPVLALTAGSAARMVAVIIVSVLALRLVLPFGAAGVLSATIFLPLAEQAGHNGWLVVFVILMMADCWLFSYQSVPLQMLIEQQRDPRDDSLSFDLAKFVALNRWSILFRIAAIYAAFPYFHAVSIL